MNGKTEIERETIVSSDGDKAKMEAIQDIVIKLVNFEAYVMDLCLEAACTLVSEKLTIKGFVTHGPDTSLSVGENPATAAIAIKLYEQVRQSMREGPSAQQS